MWILLVSFVMAGWRENDSDIKITNDSILLEPLSFMEKNLILF